MGTKTHGIQTTGYIMVCRFHGLIRIQNMIVSDNWRVGKDFDNQIDLFLPADCSDLELGVAVRKGFDETRLISGELPHRKDRKQMNKSFKDDLSVALKKVGVKTERELYAIPAAFAMATRLIPFFMFTNGKRKDGEFHMCGDADPFAWEALIPPDSDDEALGRTMREALDRMVHDPVKETNRLRALKSGITG